MTPLGKNRFANACDGTAAIEFALVSPLIFISVLGILETGLALYDQSRVSAACTAGARQILIHGASDEDAIETAVKSKFKASELSDLSIAMRTETISGEDFKEITVTYSHDTMVAITDRLDSIDLKTTCYGRGV
ncbi:TadE/TadG family type IV pilus assembly protein [Hyphococcus formosus]|uniref:TadE/TadG family type IV pilus assembly protein n=1 Tax=Hyphococcus formosus TaxID=3143534 RepID=UPI00398AE62D